MKIVTEPAVMRDEAKSALERCREIGLVPTMGALHEGHLSLIRRAVDENDGAVVSIFVNPTQFDDPDDLEKYPRTLEADLELCESAGVETVFAPAADEMYSPRARTSIFVSDLTDHLCGISRGRGHFAGVCTVVAKLLNLVRPARAYFGQKDAQQAVVVQRMALDLNFPVEIIACPTVREADGLALSSRNVRIPRSRRVSALRLYRALCLGRDLIRKGERDGAALLDAMGRYVLEDEHVALDYLSVCSPETLEDVAQVDDMVLLAGAIKLDEVRLIDNLLVDPDGPWEG